MNLKAVDSRMLVLDQLDVIIVPLDE